MSAAVLILFTLAATVAAILAAEWNRWREGRVSRRLCADVLHLLLERIAEKQATAAPAVPPAKGRKPRAPKVPAGAADASKDIPFEAGNSDPGDEHADRAQTGRVMLDAGKLAEAAEAMGRG